MPAPRTTAPSKKNAAKPTPRPRAKKAGPKTAAEVPLPEEEGSEVVDVPMEDQEPAKPTTPTKRVSKPSAKALAAKGTLVKKAEPVKKEVVTTPRRARAQPASVVDSPTVGALTADILELGVNSPKKAGRPIKGTGVITSRGRFSPDWDFDQLETMPKSTMNTQAAARVTSSTIQKSATKGRKRVTLDVSEDEEDVSMPSPVKKSRFTLGSPPPPPSDDHNPFIDDEVEVMDDTEPEEEYDDIDEEELEEEDNDEEADEWNGVEQTEEAVADNAEDDADARTESEVEEEEGESLIDAVAKKGECEISSPTKLAELGSVVCELLRPTYTGLYPLTWVDNILSYGSELNTVTIKGAMKQLGYLRDHQSKQDETIANRLQRRLVATISKPFFASAKAPARANPEAYITQRDGNRDNKIIVEASSGLIEVFVTFGASTSSQLIDHGNNGKSICVAPFCVDGLRLSGFVGSVFKVDALQVNVYQKGFSIRTRQSKDDSSAHYNSMPLRRPGARQLGEKSGVTLNPPLFKHDYLRDVRKNTSLTASDDIPIIDVREWFTGKSVGATLDFNKILCQAPRFKKEIPDHSLVAVLHSIGGYYSKGQSAMSLNVYAVALLVTPKGGF